MIPPFLKGVTDSGWDTALRMLGEGAEYRKKQYSNTRLRPLFREVPKVNKVLFHIAGGNGLFCSTDYGDVKSAVQIARRCVQKVKKFIICDPEYFHNIRGNRSAFIDLSRLVPFDNKPYCAAYVTDEFLLIDIVDTVRYI